MKRFALTFALLLAAQNASAAPALTTIIDTLYKADGSRFEGVAQIEWRSFQTADGSEIPQQTLTVKVVSGSLRVALAPTANAVKPVLYTVKFNSDGRTQFIEYWSVPASAVPLRLKDVRSQNQAGSITNGGAATINDVTGLRAELDVRPSKGNGYAATRAAVINASGNLDGALGNAADCVRVDGTSGPCGGSGADLVFVDAETPGGTVNGSNTAFTSAVLPRLPPVCTFTGTAFSNGRDSGTPSPDPTSLCWQDPFRRTATSCRLGIASPRPVLRPSSSMRTKHRSGRSTRRTRHSLCRRPCARIQPATVP